MAKKGRAKCTGKTKPRSSFIEVRHQPRSLSLPLLGKLVIALALFAVVLDRLVKSFDAQSGIVASLAIPVMRFLFPVREPMQMPERPPFAEKMKVMMSVVRQLNMFTSLIKTICF